MSFCMKIKQAEFNDFAIWVLMGFYILIAHWIWFGRGIQENLMIILMTWASVKRINRKGLFIRKNSFAQFICMAIVIIAAAISTVTAQSKNWFLADLKSMYGGFIAFFYLLTYYEFDRKRCIRYINKFCKILTIYMWINSVVILIQNYVPYFMMNLYAIKSVGNDMYEDQVTGFLGINGTTRWNIMTCVVVVYHLMVAANNRDKKSSIKYGIFAGISILLSMMNKCRALLITLPMFVMIYYFIIHRVSVNRKIKYFLGIGCVAMVMLAAYFSNSYINEYVNHLLMDKGRIYLSGNLAYMVAANDDRAVAINYGLKYGKWIGRGIGSVPMHYANDSVKYLGINSTSSYIYLIGIVGYAAYTLYFALKSCSHMGDKKGKNLTCYFLIGWLIMSYLLPVYSSMAHMFGMGLIVLIYMADNRAKGRKNENRDTYNIWRK